MHTILYEYHKALGAKIMDFQGWQMPLQYKGILEEHHAVRNHVGLFDVSHMGIIEIEGLGAEALLDYLSVSQIEGKEIGSATYTVWCNEEGGSIDDLIIFKSSETSFFIVVNAGNREKDLNHLLKYSVSKDVIINDKFIEMGILALQGKEALSLISSIFPKTQSLRSMHFIEDEYQRENLVIARTGYTGEIGFEIFASNELIVKLWLLLLEKGKDLLVQPIGLGARDSLRLEMGLALYGHELKEEIPLSETVSAWTIKWDKKDFVGKKSLEELKKIKNRRHEYGVLLEGKGVIRESYPVFKEGKKIGYVTSGTYSPSLKRSIGIVLVENNLKIKDTVEIEIRQHLHLAQIVSLPFLSSIIKRA